MADLLEQLKAALADRYAIDHEIGRGGMATVYLAEDLKHHRHVAIKVLDPELARSLGSERFLREVEVTAKLTHPHILTLIDSGEADGLLYYVMPYIEGETLRDRMNREGQLPIDDALQITREVAAALSHAHSHHVIHRDIKPENILLSAGEAVVADFGIARAVTEAGGDNLTETGISIGTPAYMSPEQASGAQKLDGRSDVYSLGCVLYELLAGEPPFTGPTAQAIVAKKLSEATPRVSVVRELVPSSVEAAIDQALAKAPADRFATALQFLEALSAERVSEAAPVVPAKRGVRRRIALLGVAAAVVLVAAILLGRGLEGSRFPQTAIAVLPFENLSADGSHSYFAGGLHDELLTQLAKVAMLRPISRTSVMGYAETDKSISEIADDLAVGTIVEGSVQVVGDRLRVNVRLIDAATDEHLWVDRYDETLDDAFAIQSDIAQQIVMAVGGVLTGAEANAITAVPTDDAEAYRFYLQGREYHSRPGGLEQNMVAAQQLYERALTLDPEFALAHAALSRIHGTMYWWAYDRSRSRRESQRAAAETALRLAPELPEAHAAMVYVHYYGDLDYERALEEATLLVERMPGDASVWNALGSLHRRLGHWDDVLAAFEKMLELDPLDVSNISLLGAYTYKFLHRFEEAIDVFDRVLELAPDYHLAELNRAWTYLLWHGDLDTLRLVLEHAPVTYGARGPSDRWRARLALWERNPVELLRVIDESELVMFEARLGYEPKRLFAAWAHQILDDSTAAAAAYTDALAQLDSAAIEFPGDWRVTASRGLALAGLGRGNEALVECDRLLESPIYEDHFTRPVLHEARALIFAQVGLADEALGEIEPLVAEPSWTSAAVIRLDPRYDPIRDDPRFQALLEQYEN